VKNPSPAEPVKAQAILRARLANTAAVVVSTTPMRRVRHHLSKIGQENALFLTV